MQAFYFVAQWKKKLILNPFTLMPIQMYEIQIKHSQFIKLIAVMCVPITRYRTQLSQRYILLQ